jgi:hypothetical protein
LTVYTGSKVVLGVLILAQYAVPSTIIFTSYD